MASSWTSLQIVTLAVDALTPVAVAGLGVVFARTSRRTEQVQWANQTVVTHRLDVFSRLAPGLNQLLCFATFVGGWKGIEPGKAIEIKRNLDEIMYANRILFSGQLFTAYDEFMHSQFAMYSATDADAHLRAPIASRWGDRRNMPWWDEGSMAHLFSPDHSNRIEDVQSAYEKLMELFRAELYVTRQGQPLLPTQPVTRHLRRRAAPAPAEAARLGSAQHRLPGEGRSSRRLRLALADVPGLSTATPSAQRAPSPWTWTGRGVVRPYPACPGPPSCLQICL